MAKLKFEGLQTGGDYPAITGGDYDAFRWKGLEPVRGPVDPEAGGGLPLVNAVLTVGSGNGAAFHPGNDMVVIRSRDGADFSLIGFSVASFEGAHFTVIGLHDGERVAAKRHTFNADIYTLGFGEEFASVDTLRIRRWDARGSTAEIITEPFAMDDFRFAWTVAAKADLLLA